MEVLGDTQARIHWDGPASAQTVIDDNGFTIDGFPPLTADDVFGDPNATDVINNTDWMLAPGSLWDLSAQPNWLLTPAAVPQSGACV